MFNLKAQSECTTKPNSHFNINTNLNNIKSNSPTVLRCRNNNIALGSSLVNFSPIPLQIALRLLNSHLNENCDGGGSGREKRRE